MYPPWRVSHLLYLIDAVTVDNVNVHASFISSYATDQNSGRQPGIKMPTGKSLDKGYCF